MLNKTQMGFSLFEALLALFFAGLLINLAAYYAIKNYQAACALYHQDQLLNVMSCYLSLHRDRLPIRLSSCAALMDLKLKQFAINQASHQLSLSWRSSLHFAIHCKAKAHHACWRIKL